MTIPPTTLSIRALMNEVAIRVRRGSTPVRRSLRRAVALERAADVLLLHVKGAAFGAAPQATLEQHCRRVHARH
jgi:hypothetical protein